ncbi:Receptor-type tyrosine- phosphatase [Brachionus plicatilis]|uniref:Receptor-type tyrosine-phosphatase n=1 Tax=Brachionus plicatilis TaxID=10195 RepID=A0A3M7SMS4_BRAPC|nr:Receptor-type tyrosine- phosphatase [Brachionus plicatilis]
MIWEKQTVVVVCLTNPQDKCFQYWPEKEFKIYNKFEIHFTSEHIWNDDIVVRNFFFKNIETHQTRTVTHFQLLSWEEEKLPTVKSFLDFRKIVNKSYSSKTCPIVVSCNDGMGRTGTYILIDMVLNKIAKGAKEIDLAATLEFLRDQRPHMVRLKEQYEFSFEVVTHEIKQNINFFYIWSMLLLQIEVHDQMYFIENYMNFYLNHNLDTLMSILNSSLKFSNKDLPKLLKLSTFKNPSLFVTKVEINLKFLLIKIISFLENKLNKKSFFQGSSEWQSLLFSPHEFGVLIIESKGVLYFKLFLEEF